MKNQRLSKVSNFETFYDKSKTLFTTLRDKDERADAFEREYMLSVCPGSRNGGTDKRIVEVFWGSRPYEFETIRDSWKAFSEQGCTLFFYRNDTGDVTVSLYPAKTEFRRPLEDYIILYEWLNPRKLNDDIFIKSLWNDFMAYMEHTSLDGKPVFLQKLRISYLKFFKHSVIDKQWKPTRFSIFIKEIFKWVLTVGLSGVIIFVVTILTQPKTTETEIQLKEINKRIEKISRQIDTGGTNKEEDKKRSRK